MSVALEKSAIEYLLADKRHECDQKPKPKWAPGPDGRYVDISADVRFDALWADWLADACEHGRTGIVSTTNLGGQVIYNWYCAHCGCKLSSNIKKAAALAHGVKDVALDSLASRSHAYVADRDGRLAKLITEAAQRAQNGNRENYDDYLRSEHWKNMRLRILARSGGRCEGCLDAPAEQVHHLTYDHKGAEFAFELIALCAPCHQRWHGDIAA